MKMERKSNQIKLPAIQQKGKDNLKVLSNTMPDNIAKARPISLSKVQDLEKKLFSKLDAYQNASRKGANKKGSRSRKFEQSQNGMEVQAEGYDKLQKLMPTLYNKLIEVKKGSLNDLPSSTTEPPSYKSQAKILNRQSTSATSRRQQKHGSIFVTSKQTKDIEDIKVEVSEEEMNEMYEEYMKKENLIGETSSKDLQDLSQSIVICEKQIEQLTKSMQGLIREIGLECLVSYEQNAMQ